MKWFKQQVPVVVNADYANEGSIDLITSNEHIIDSEVSVHILTDDDGTFI